MKEKTDKGSKFRMLVQHRDECIKKGESYRLRFESAIDEKEGFKFLLLMDLECLETYITQTYIHAEQSFNLSRRVARAGSLLLFGAIVLGTVSQLLPHMPPIQTAYLSAIAGLISQLISGVFFYFYHMTLRQVNLFHSQLESSRKVCVSLYLQSLMTDETTEQNKVKLELIKLLVQTGRSDQLDEASKEKLNGNRMKRRPRPPQVLNRL